MTLTISVITAVSNRVDTIGQTLASVQAQTWSHVEHIVIDGASTDGTLRVLEAQRNRLAVLVSEPDGGIYDALNKGFACASGDVVGVMHSDDFYAHERVLEKVASAFADSTVDAVYGDLDYVARADTDHVVRRWRSGYCSRARLRRGWMPPHPTLYLRRRVIEEWGLFDISFRIAADYDVILRYLWQGKIRAHYIPEVLVKMRVGGESNRSLAHIVRKSR
ncbi:MAG: glycosyltransferase, partial [Halioglobus sp.]|nr:glycosyltransferase [Halioglobus sp.]